MADSETIVTQPESSLGSFSIFKYCKLFYLQFSNMFPYMNLHKSYCKRSSLCELFNGSNGHIFLCHSNHSANL